MSVKLVKSDIEEIRASGILTLQVADVEGTGKDKKESSIGDAFRFDLRELPEEITGSHPAEGEQWNYLVCHGITQKIGDSCAKSKDVDLTPDFVKERTEPVWEALKAGQWATRTRGESEGPIELLGKAVFLAFSAAGKETFDDGSPITEEGCIERAKARDKKGRAELRRVPAIATELSKLREPKKTLEDVSL
jgi:hypothetical protein